MAEKKAKDKAKLIVGKTFDAAAFAVEVSVWLKAGGEEELERDLLLARRDRDRLARSLEVRPKTMSEAVTY